MSRNAMTLKYSLALHNCGLDSTAGDGALIAQAFEWALVRPDRPGRSNIKFRAGCMVVSVNKVGFTGSFVYGRMMPLYPRDITNARV